MARASDFLVGLLGGSAIAVAVFVGIRFFNDGGADDLVSGDAASAVTAASHDVPRGERALPAEGRTRDCDLATEIRAAMDATVVGPGGEPGDYPTAEARFDKVLGAVECAQLGAVYTLDPQELAPLPDLVRRVARRARVGDHPQADRAWGARALALGQELLSADPERLWQLGLEFMQAGLDAMIESVARRVYTKDEAIEVLLIVRALESRRMVPAQVVAAVGLNALATVDVAPDPEVVERAEAWWRGVVAWSQFSSDEPEVLVEADPVAPLTRGGARVGTLLRSVQRDHQMLQVVLSVAAASEGCEAPWTEAPVLLGSSESIRLQTDPCAVHRGSSSWAVAR